jgi:hypothetical protein
MAAWKIKGKGAKAIYGEPPWDIYPAAIDRKVRAR